MAKLNAKDRRKTEGKSQGTMLFIWTEVRYIVGNSGAIGTRRLGGGVHRRICPLNSL